jgi:hypothetical protein
VTSGSDNGVSAALASFTPASIAAQMRPITVAMNLLMICFPGRTVRGRAFRS